MHIYTLCYTCIYVYGILTNLFMSYDVYFKLLYILKCITSAYIL